MEWKEKAARQVAGLPPGERIRAIILRAKPTVAALKRRKVRVVRKARCVVAR